MIDVGKASRAARRLLVLALFCKVAGCSGDVSESGSGAPAFVQGEVPSAPDGMGPAFAPDPFGPQGGQSGVGADGAAGIPGTGQPEPVNACGNGVLDAGETCDPPGSCPTACEAADVCSAAVLMGSAQACSAQCVQTPITECVTGDGCCPDACSSNEDADCDPQCGNGVLEEGEQCDPLESCPEQCDDGNACTEDSLGGMAEDCSAACMHVPVEGCQPDHARGVRVTSVTLDQGVRIPLAEQRQPIAPDARNVELVAHRPAMLRAFWELDADFAPRPIRARLTLQRPDGTEEVLEASAQVDAATPDYGALSSSFVWRLPAESVVPDLQYAIELFESDDARNSEPLPAEPPRFPAEGVLPVGVAETYLKMRVMLVPLAHDVGQGCPAPDLHADLEGRSEADYIAERLYAMNPVDEVEMVVHEPVSFTGSARDSGPIFSLLRQLRAQDNADPGFYYFALIDPCDGGPNFSGVASLGSPSRNAANRRTGWGVYRDRGRSAGMVVHEIGHQQGRNHVACSGQEAGPDPDYPNNNGDTDSWGWDVLSEDRLLDPDRHDYMSYCNQTWVGEYGWNFVYPRLETISGWELEQFSLHEVPVLHVMVQADSSIDAWIANGGVEAPQRDGVRVRFYEAGGRLHAEAMASYEPIPKSTAYALAIATPAEFSRVTHLEFEVQGRTHLLDAAQITRIR